LHCLPHFVHILHAWGIADWGVMYGATDIPSMWHITRRGCWGQTHIWMVLHFTQGQTTGASHKRKWGAVGQRHMCVTPLPRQWNLLRWGGPILVWVVRTAVFCQVLDEQRASERVALRRSLTKTQTLHTNLKHRIQAVPMDGRCVGVLLLGVICELHEWGHFCARVGFSTLNELKLVWPKQINSETNVFFM